MKTRSPLLRRQAHRRRVRRRPRRSRVVLTPQAPTAGTRRTSSGRSADELGALLCPDEPRRLRADRHGRLPGHRRRSTGRCSKTREVALRRRPRAARQDVRDPSFLQTPEDPGRATTAGSSRCAAATSTTPPRRSWTTGPARSSPTRAARSYTAKGTKKFQPQFDVLSDGWRQPGSSIKPINYVDRHRRPDAHRGHDVHGRRHRLRQAGFTPTQADRLERGPVRLRTALQFSLNIPAIKAELIRASTTCSSATRTSGSATSPAPRRCVDGHRHARDAPDRPAPALRRDRQRRRADAAHRSSSRSWTTRTAGLATARHADRGQARRQPAGGLHHHGHPGRQHDHEINPYWGEWAIYDGRTPPAGRLQDGHDERQQATSTPTATWPRRRTRRPRPSRSASGWATATTTRTTAACRSTRPRRSGRRSCTRSARTCRSRSSRRRAGSRRRRSTRSPGSARARSRTKTVKELSSRARSPTKRKTSASRSRSTRRPACSGRTAASARR